MAAWTHDDNILRLHAKRGGRTPGEIAGQQGRVHAPSPLAITSTISHQSQGFCF